jgi:hypothetical protein
LAVTAKVTVPLADPLAPPVTVNHDVLLLVAVQVQPVPAVTAVVEDAAAEVIKRKVGETV